MSRRYLAGIAVLAAAILMPAASASAEMKIGVVDVVEVLNEYEATKEAQADLKMEETELRNEAKPKIEKIEDLKMQQKSLNKESEAWEKLDEQIMQKTVEFKTWFSVQQARIDRKHQGVLRKLYEDIQGMVAEAAKEKGLDLVFTKAFLSQPAIDVQNVQNLEDLKGRIVAQQLMYPGRDTVTDLTASVIDRLNQAFKAAGEGQ